MRLLEAVVEANRKAAQGDPAAGLRPAEFAESLPVVALTCIDSRLNRILPEVLGIPQDQFVWLRNAGNVVTGPLSSTIRSLSLACVVEGAREIVVIGHTDCRFGQQPIVQLLEGFARMGITRNLLPDNLPEFLGVFSSERQNVIKATDLIRQSPIISPAVPVHGLLVDVETGILEWVVNGYEAPAVTGRFHQAMNKAAQVVERIDALTDSPIGSGLKNWRVGRPEEPEPKITQEQPVAESPAPPKLSMPPVLKPKLVLRNRRS